MWSRQFILIRDNWGMFYRVARSKCGNILHPVNKSAPSVAEYFSRSGVDGDLRAGIYYCPALPLGQLDAGTITTRSIHQASVASAVLPLSRRQTAHPWSVVTCPGSARDRQRGDSPPLVGGDLSRARQRPAGGDSIATVPADCRPALYGRPVTSRPLCPAAVPAAGTLSLSARRDGWSPPPPPPSPRSVYQRTEPPPAASSLCDGRPPRVAGSGPLFFFSRLAARVV